MSVKENNQKNEFKKALRRLKRSTKHFSTYIVRDPLDYLDFEVDLDKNLDELIYEINAGRYHPQKPYLHTSPKNKGINRPTVILDIKDAIAYRYCIEQIEDELFCKARRKKNIRGGIKITKAATDEGDGFYEKWFEDWIKHNNAIEEALKYKPFLAATDIASYFENINILILKDLIRSDVEGKKNILNLLFYFLENTRFRYQYETNTFTGLIQEDIDCSRILAYYFLHIHDEKMLEFCEKYEGDFFRFVDDMSILVNSKPQAKKALKALTESLRRLGLVASIEKTVILDAASARKELFFEENKKLSELENKILEKLKLNQETKEIELNIKKYYEELRNEKKEFKNWIKILKRFYTICTYANSNILFSDLLSDIVELPLIFSNNKILKYLIRTQSNINFNKILLDIIHYLYSDENLYPALESHLLEIFLFFDEEKFNQDVRKQLEKLSFDVFFKQNNYEPLSEYARAIACLLTYRFNKIKIKKLAEHYIKSSERDGLLKKYMIFISLTLNNQPLRDKVFDKAKKEQDYSINRLINLIENIDKYKNKKLIKNYLSRNKIYVYKKNKEDFEIAENYNPVRAEILKNLIQIYSNNN
ncbi:MAG: hypothetical protein ACFFE4_16710 [Candidatus Thorarchaeota archaeon]